MKHMQVNSLQEQELMNVLFFVLFFLLSNKLMDCHGYRSKNNQVSYVPSM